MVKGAVEQAGVECRFDGCWLLEVTPIGYQFTMQYYVETAEIAVFRDRVHTVWITLLKRLRDDQIELAECRTYRC